MSKIFKWRDALFSFLFISGIAQADPAKLTEVTVTATADKARINISFSKTPGYKVFTLANPPRVVIDLKDTDLKANLRNLQLAATPLTTIRSGAQPNHGLRLVVDLKKPLAAQRLSTSVDQDGRHLIVELGGPLPAVTVAKAEPALPVTGNKPQDKTTKNPVNKTDVEAVPAVLAKNGQNAESAGKNENNKPGTRIAAEPKPLKEAANEVKEEPAKSESKKLMAKLAAEIEHDSAAEPAVNAAPKKTTLIGKTTLKNPKNIVVKGTRDVVIVIDPGHGGKDSGARGANGTYEKNVVLAISKKLQQLIEQEPGMHAVLTRKGDYFIGLRERLRIARKDKADLFIAIHADAFTNPNSSGASVFALSSSGASSEAARWLAEKENYSELGGIPLSDKSDLLRSVLIDLSQTGIISLSLQLGNYLLKDLGKIAHLHHGSVEQARFVVLKSLDIPSVLVETGFISNEQEERRLNDPHYQQQLAEALFQGIRNYFRQYPPPGTRLAAEKEISSSALAKAEAVE